MKIKIFQMGKALGLKVLAVYFVVFLCSCEKQKKENGQTDFFNEYTSRNFRMGFTTWPFGPNVADVEETYDFINENADIYTEHIDNNIPWKAWINGDPLPDEFLNEIDHRIRLRMNDKKMLLSVGLLNLERSNLAEDMDGPMILKNINDPIIEDAYIKHLQYLIGQFNPDYLLIAIESNELLLNSPEKWDEYVLLITNVRTRLKQVYPEMLVSESVTLHNLYQPEVENPDEYRQKIFDHINKLDFIAISHYPYFKNQHSKEEYQKTFDFLHASVSKPIAFVETCQLAEDLSVPNFSVFIEGNEENQNEYLETLFINAQENNYEFVTWWAYRDFDTLWQTFPESLKDLGIIWRDTGLIDETGKARNALSIWKMVLNKEYR